MIVPTVLLTVLASSVWSQSIDLRTNARVTHPWMETGFVSVNDAEWVTVTSMGTEYVNPVVLTALPDLGGDLYTTGLATATRIRNLVNNAGQVTFDVKVWTLPLLSPHTSFSFLLSSSNLTTLIVPKNGMFPNTSHQMLRSVGPSLNMALTMSPPNICLLLGKESRTEPAQLLV
jgi:hypothetical protein